MTFEEDKSYDIKEYVNLWYYWHTGVLSGSNQHLKYYLEQCAFYKTRYFYANFRKEVDNVKNFI